MCYNADNIVCWPIYRPLYFAGFYEVEHCNKHYLGDLVAGWRISHIPPPPQIMKPQVICLSRIESATLTLLFGQIAKVPRLVQPFVLL